MTASHGTIFGLVPYDLQTLWNALERRFLVPTFLGVGWAVNLWNTHRHLLQTLLLAGLVWWRLRFGRRG